MGGLHHLTKQYRFMVASGYRLILLLSSAGGPALRGIPFSLSFSYQAYGETPLPEVDPPGDPGLDLPGPVETQCLCENNVGKDEGSPGVPCPPNHPPALRSQYGREAAPYCARGSGVLASQLCR